MEINEFVDNPVEDKSQLRKEETSKAVRKLTTDHQIHGPLKQNRFDRERRHHKKKNSQDPQHRVRKGQRYSGANAPPRYVHCSDWREMLAITGAGKKAISGVTSKSGSKRESPTRTPAIQVINEVNGTFESPEDGDDEDNLIDKTSIKSDQTYNNKSTLPTPFNQSNISLPGSIRCKTSKQVEALLESKYISETFKKLECNRFIATVKDEKKCGCGRLKADHDLKAFQDGYKLYTKHGTTKWSILKHTAYYPTDAHGIIEFQGGAHPTKASYLRLSFDTEPSKIVELISNIWHIQPPKLIITLHGGMTNFDIQSKLARVFRKGLLKAARTTGAWIITSGINAGVVRHVAAALEGGITSTGKGKSKIICIGIAPWGLLKKRDAFIGQETVLPYHPHSFSTKGKFQTLNNRHNYFLLVDNGTVGRYGADIILRRRLESYICQKQKMDQGDKAVPIVCVVLEGGTCTIRTVLDYVSNKPQVPVVVCDGSGRASDLLAFAHKFVQNDGTLPDGVVPQLIQLIKSVFFYGELESKNLLEDLLACVKNREMLTVFRLGESHKQDVDHAILTALLKGHNLSPSEQLSLALAWDRVDIAKSDLFVMGQNWPAGALHNAMMEALIHNRVAFVRLLLENGVSMSNFLTIPRLEELYNTDKGPPNTLYYIVRDVVKIRSGYRYKLPDIGLAVEKLMGYGFRSFYTSKKFHQEYKCFRKSKEAYHYTRTSHGTAGVGLEELNINSHNSLMGSPSLDTGLGTMMTDSIVPDQILPAGSRALSNHILWRSAFKRENMSIVHMAPPELDMGDNDDDDNSNPGTECNQFQFRYPFSDLLMWAVLTKRHQMALCMWQHGEEAMAKSLVATRLYKSLYKEAAEDALEVEVCEELKNCAEDFRVLSLELLDHCYKYDDAQTLQLLTYELKHFGQETCLSLAVLVNNKQFLSHPCCQILLADLWHGGLRIRSNSNLKVILGIMFLPTIFLLEFKTREELLLQPQTAAEHEEAFNDIDNSSEGSSSSSSDSSSASESENEFDKYDSDFKTRRNSSLSSYSNNGKDKNHIRRKKRYHTFNAGNMPINTVITKEQQALEQGLKMNPKRLRTLSSRDKDSIHSGSRPDIESLSGVVDNSRRASSTHLFKNKGSNDHLVKIVNNKQNGGVKAMAVTRSKQIKTQRKIYEFLVAPITTFWAWCISFILFLIGLTYVLLIKTPKNPTMIEWSLFAYVVSFGIEHGRKFFMSGPKRFKEKFVYFFSNIWYLLTTLAVIGFWIGFLIRTFVPSMIQHGRVILAVNSVLWSVKLLDYLSVHHRFGPYITMAGKMIQSMSYIVVMLVVSLLSFGLARQSITFPNEKWDWILVRNIFYKPYFMLYGEVYAPEIDECGDGAWDRHLANGSTVGEEYRESECVIGHWFSPILMTIFLLISNILLMSMLIAIFNHIFDSTNNISQQIWLFQRYRQVMEYESTPFVPPPFVIFYHFYMIGKYLKHRVKEGARNSKQFSKYFKPRIDNEKEDKRTLFDYSLKLFLNHDQVEKLHDFEEECMDELQRMKDQRKHTSTDERISRINEKTEAVVCKLNDIMHKETKLKNSITEIENRLEAFDQGQLKIMNHLEEICKSLGVKMKQPYSKSGNYEDMEETRITSDFAIPSCVEGGASLEPIHERLIKMPLHMQKSDSERTVGEHIRKRNNTLSGNESADMMEQMVGGRASRSSEGHLGSSRMSLDHRLFSASTPSKSGNKRNNSPQNIRSHGRHEEYTSITDTIAFDNRVRKDSRSEEKNDRAQMLSITDREEFETDYESDSKDYNKTIPCLKRAKSSYVNKINDVYRQLEEEIGSRDEDQTSDYEATSAQASKRNSLSGDDDNESAITFIAGRKNTMVVKEMTGTPNSKKRGL
uniref:LSDAT_euk domain-containing protein n=1 Tax=Rhabditophanes sp. KR3021 TaxID=114890 RepID=A0AC35U2P5_9BILA